MAKTMKPWVKVFDAAEATTSSGVLDCRGYNAVALYVTLSAAQNWTFSIRGSMSVDGPFLPVMVDGSALSKQTNASALLLFRDLPDYIDILATEDANGATVTGYASVCEV